MPEMLRPDSLGISGLLELARMVTPPDHEIVGYEDENGVFFSFEQLKALEGQEIQMDPMKALQSLDFSLTQKRELTFCFRHGETIVAIGNDETAWILSPNKKEWLPMQDMRLPNLPQGVSF